jgi:phosphatidylinositol glycan class F
MMSVTKTDAINVLNTDAAKIYTHLHPFLVLSSYFLNFSSIVADPVSSLLKCLIPLGILQIAYVVVCLPATGSTHSAPTTKGSGKGGASKKASRAKGGSLSSRITVRGMPLAMVVHIG